MFDALSRRTQTPVAATTAAASERASSRRIL
jgi:hypothetical protein